MMPCTAVMHLSIELTYWLYEHYTSRNNRIQDIIPMYLLETLQNLALEVNLESITTLQIKNHISSTDEIDIGHNQSYVQPALNSRYVVSRIRL